MQSDSNAQSDIPAVAKQPSLGNVIGAFKSLTTNAYIAGVAEKKVPRFSWRLWQRNYYERIVRNEIELNRIRLYIQSNPARWAEDEHNPVRTPAADVRST